MKKRGIFSNKKAQGDIESYFVIIKLILAISAIAAMSAYVYSVASDTFFQKLYFSRDISFMVNILYSAPGNVYQIYERKGLDKFQIDFNEQKVQIKEGDVEKKGLSFDYFYAANLDYMFKKYWIKNSKKIVFQKSNHNFELNSELDEKLKLLKCPDIVTTTPEWKQKFFLIDLGDISSIENNKEDIEKAVLGSIGFSLYNQFENKDTTMIDISNIKNQMKKSNLEVKALIQQRDVIISAHIGNYLRDNNNIKAYVSSIGDKDLVKKRNKMGCLIINELFSDKDLNNIFTGGNVVNVNPEHIRTDYEEMLNNDKISVILEIGNIQNEKINDLQNVEIITKIVDSIYNGIKKYYD